LYPIEKLARTCKLIEIDENEPYTATPTAYENQVNYNIPLSSGIGYYYFWVWYKDKKMWADQLIETYFSNPAYNEYPVVGVSWQQASAYCDWLNRSSSYPIYGETKYYYRLPTAAEFEYCQNFQNIKKTKEGR
jgi:formylglycine-generating enzyme required for sulfatase activity